MDAYFNKKADVSMVLTGVMTLALAGMLLIFGLIMLDELLLNTADSTYTVDNETLTTVTEAGEQVVNYNKCGFNSFSVSYAFNATDNTSIASSKYTVDPRQGKVFAVAGGSVNNTNWYVTYTYKASTSEACEATNKTIEGNSTFAGYFDLIALAIVITIVISLLVVVLGTREVK